MINFPRIVTNYTFEGEPCELLSIDFEKSIITIKQKEEIKEIFLKSIEIKIEGIKT